MKIESKTETESPNNMPKMKERNIILGLLFALAISVIGQFVLSNKLEAMERNYDALTRDARVLSEINEMDTREWQTLVNSMHDALRECESFHKAQ